MSAVVTRFAAVSDSDTDYVFTSHGNDQSSPSTAQIK